MITLGDRMEWFGNGRVLHLCPCTPYVHPPSESLCGRSGPWAARMGETDFCPECAQKAAELIKPTGPKFWGMARKQPTPKVGVGVILRNQNGQILMGIRKGSHGAGQWSLPGGHMDLGEDFFTTCKREMLEETGITIGDVEEAGFANNIFESEGLHYVTLFFEAVWDMDQKPKNMEPDRTERWEWFDKANLPDDVFGAIKEAIRKGII